MKIGVIKRKGTQRRRIIDKALRSGRFDQVQDVLVDAAIPNKLRQKLGAIHPCFMGGEYLPGYLEGDIHGSEFCGLP